MNIENIQKKLNTLFAQPGRHRLLVLWYDEKGAYAEDIPSLQLDNAAVIVLNGHNFISSKYRIERQEKETNFLIYAPFPKPGTDDAQNHFLDIQFIAVPFYADALYDLCTAYGIPKALKPVLERQASFWKKAENGRKFSELSLPAYTEETLSLGVMAVLAKIKTTQIDEIMKAVLRSGTFTQNPLLAKFQKAGVENDFWHSCTLEYGYAVPEGETPDLTGFFLHCTYSYIQQKCGRLPKKWHPVCRTNATAAIFLSNLISQKQKFPWLMDALAKVGIHLQISQILNQADLAAFYECDLFAEVDQAFISRFSQLLTSSPRSFNEQELACIHYRETTACYADIYLHYYKALEYAQTLFAALQRCQDERQQLTDIASMTNAYSQHGYNVDVYYRKFYHHYDQCEDTDLLGTLQEQVEKRYIADYLEPLTAQWGSLLKMCQNYDALPGMKQTDFYSWYIGQQHKETMVVIISDAFRYECGQELFARLSADANMEAQIEPMWANVPTYTQLGMASLLPHGKLSLERKGNMMQAYSDSLPTAGSANREKIIRQYEPDAKVMKLGDILSLSRTAVRQQLKDVHLLYLYQNEIDSTGDDQKKEDKVFVAVAQAIEEICRVIRKLAVDKSISHFIVTADHGFLYRRSGLPEYAKIKLEKLTETDYRNKRYILSAKPLEGEGIITWPLTQIESKYWLNVPLGCGIFSLPGGGQHFVHGGLSLQELLVPVVKVKYHKQRVDKTKVNVSWYSPQTRLTETNNYLKFLQEDVVTDTKRPRRVSVKIVDQEQHQISNEAIIVADRTTTDAVDRIYTEKLMLPEKTYKNTPAQLILCDAEDGDELVRYDVVIDVLEKKWTL